jgi:hypothetical protein
MDAADFKADTKFNLLIWNIKTRIGENFNTRHFFLKYGGSADRFCIQITGHWVLLAIFLL